MAIETFQGVLDDLRALGTRQVDLVGRGEPLLNPQALEMVGLAKERGFRVTMISNGSRLDAGCARALVDLGLDRYQLSLDAASGETYSRIHVSEGADAFGSLKKRIANLSAERSRKGLGRPQITLSFTIGALNYLELEQMVGTVDEVGADGGHFQHCLPVTPAAESTALSDEQYEHLLATVIPAAVDRASLLGVDTNLRGFASAPPAYRLDRAETGPSVVPCYIGSYFTAILGNGKVMPCCQTEKAVGSIEDGGFREVWQGDAYAEFRRAARLLPQPSPALDTCQCDGCYFRPHNIAIHQKLHPLSRRRGIADQRLSVNHLRQMSRLDQE
jgi:MoaA/NifB/PqqE/SkfB family radical SAM enzyme